MGKFRMEEKAEMSILCPFLLFILTGFAIAIIITSSLLIPEGHDLIQEYKNNSALSKFARNSCKICEDNSTKFLFSNPECRKGFVNCYLNKANVQASLLDYAELLRNDFNQGFNDKDYEFGTIEKANIYIETREMELLNYPETWASISIAGICLGSIQLIILCIGLVFWVKYHKDQRMLLLKISICISSALCLATIIIFTLAMVWKINYSCPGVAYKSQFGCGYTYNGEDESPKTHGRAMCGFLGANFVAWFIFIIIFVLNIRTIKN